jgi:hypothetical protein
MARLERPMSWHPNSQESYDYSSYYQHPSTTQTTPSSMYSRSSYEWPDDNMDVVPSYPGQRTMGGQQFQSYFQCPSVAYSRNRSAPYNAMPSHTQQQYWPDQVVGPSQAYSTSQAGIEYHPQPQYTQPTSLPPYDTNTNSWQQVETPDLVEDVSPGSTNTSGGDELVGLGLYDSTPAAQGIKAITRGKSLRLAEGWVPAENWSPPGHKEQKKQEEHGTRDNGLQIVPTEQKQAAEYQSQQMYPPNNIDDHSWMFDPNVVGQVWFGEVDNAGNPVYEY